METRDLTFIVDLNEVEDDLCPVSMDYTLNYGPRVYVCDRGDKPLALGSWVRVHSDDDDTLYHALVVTRLSDRDYQVRIAWDTCVPVLNKGEWSARTESEASRVHIADRNGSPTGTANDLVDR
ncbi:MAG: hypothetical protein H0T54_06315 [Geodermatophilaceae bacterium]|nr:hypothetical protein [Geodermatophilaceae bacterium]